MTTTADFLSEGAKDYIDALAAIEKFEEEVGGVCKDIYKKYQTELASKMGLEDAECEDHDNKDPANRYTELGVRQDTAGVKRSMSMSYGMTRRRERPKCQHAFLSSSPLKMIEMKPMKSCIETRPVQSNTVTVARIHTFYCGRN